ncbi:MAG: DNA polymerase III subunit delta [Clostridia bacterium]|nr:DNA polymerase III subunit delta [Clostridia bacterium]
MKFTQLKDDIKEGAKSIYLIEGDDAYFRAKAEEQIKSAFLEMPELNFTAFDGAQYKGANLTDITSALSAFPFMAEKRIVKITDFYPTEGDYEKYIKPVFENFPETTILIIVNTQGKKGVDLKRKKFVTYIDCNKADRETVAKWAYLTMKRAGVSSTVEACEAVADYCLCDMARVSREVEKLIEYGKEGGVNKAVVDELVYKDADYRVYQMTGAIARRDYGGFSEICYDLLDKGFDENAVIGSLLNYFKNLLTVLSSDASDRELMASLKMTDYVLGKTKQQARAVGEQKLIAYINALYSLSSSFKSGQITQRGAFESAIARVFFD